MTLPNCGIENSNMFAKKYRIIQKKVVNQNQLQLQIEELVFEDRRITVHFIVRRKVVLQKF